MRAAWLLVAVASAANAFTSPGAPLPSSAAVLGARRGLRGGAGGLLCGSVPSVKDDMLGRVLNVAEEAAREAGLLIQEKTGASVQKTKLSSKDLLTEVDPMCQKIIEAKVKAAFPDHGFLGEESVEPGAKASAAALKAVEAVEWLWIVDPIDGTTNFVHQIPASVVSIGVAHRGKLVAGVIMDPFRDELFAAAVGCGAYMNGEKISCGEEATLGEATIAAGSPTQMASINPALRGINALMPHCRTIRMFGSAALHLAWIACGRLTAYFEPDLHAWDTAAGAVLVREAGGRLSALDGDEFTVSTRAVLASNGKTHAPILSTLQGAQVLGLDVDGIEWE